MNLLDVSNISMGFPNKELFSDLSFTIKEGERVAVLGINGAGKSTLLAVLAGAVSYTHLTLPTKA